MRSESTTASAQKITEKPHHSTYLKEFRTKPCLDFSQHKCPFHRPFLCFNYHFENQRRRVPIKLANNLFNYSPDVYCTKYDETKGQCSDGDSCVFLHKNAGDTERRYHLRYFKTSICIYESDSKNVCTKNGQHCAFAHGIYDIRQPVFDSRDETSERLDPDVRFPSTLDKERNAINENPNWLEQSYVLNNYKCEPCVRPPKMCRQGYACPMYHNPKDKRRSPMSFKYRSTPCPSVKISDEWGEPSNCESGTDCSYCHTRVEQQFHPEIYKSTKCNDMLNKGKCPRGPFCAFSHHDVSSASRNRADSNTALSVLSEDPTDSPTKKHHPSSGGESTGSSDAVALVQHSSPGVISRPRTTSSSSDAAIGSFPNMWQMEENQSDSHKQRKWRNLRNESPHRDIQPVNNPFDYIGSPLFYDNVDNPSHSALDDLNLDENEDKEDVSDSEDTPSQNLGPMGMVRAGNVSAPVNIPTNLNGSGSGSCVTTLVDSISKSGSLHGAFGGDGASFLDAYSFANSPSTQSPIFGSSIESGSSVGSSRFEGLHKSEFSTSKLDPISEMSDIPLRSLLNMQSQLRNKLEKISKVITQRELTTCVRCQERPRQIRFFPCTHYVMCEICAINELVCPLCQSRINEKKSMP